jgi:hypothetical protein
MKTCTTCNTEKSLSEFFKDGRNKDKHNRQCKPCFKAYQNKWIDENKDKKAKSNASWYYRTKHNITYEEFIERAAKQNNKCALCSIDLTFDKIQDSKAVMDHCHTTGVKRGVLCYACNLGLGKFKDNIEALQKSVNYLKEHQN